MPALPPYHISHLDLAWPPVPPAFAPQAAGRYVVFWWQDIPLGHLLVEPGQGLSAAETSRDILAAIRPAVTHYATKALAPAAEWAAWLTPQDFARWQGWMGAVLAEWRPAALPAQVPVSVIICTRSRAAVLERCLAALTSMSCQPAEIIVIDNAPEDATTQQVVAAYPGIRYYVEAQPGLSYARNTGLAKASCDIIAFTDDDVLVGPKWAFNVWDTFQDSQVAAMTGLVLVTELLTEAQQIFEKHWSFNRGYVEVCYDGAYVQRTLPDGPPVWDIGAGANMAFRKAVVAEVGPFDVRLGAGASGCSEDSEMWYRILLRGYTIRYNPRAVVYHGHRREIAGLTRQLYYYMRGHAAAALLQQAQYPAAGYQQHLYRNLPRYYAMLLRAGFPRFRFRSRTLWAELRGLVSGVFFYYRHRRPTPPPTPPLP